MDGPAVLTTVGVVFTGIVTLGGFVLTRRSARETSAVTGFVSLTGALETRLEKVEARAEKAEASAAHANERAEKLEQDARRKGLLAERHQPWDVQIYEQAVAAGWDVSPPPPLT